MSRRPATGGLGVPPWGVGVPHATSPETALYAQKADWSHAFRAGYWIVDSGANTVVCPPDDPAIIKRITGDTSLTVTGGVVAAQAALVRTPLGIRVGALIAHSCRIIPMAEFGENGQYSWINGVVTAIHQGVTVPLSVSNRIPYLSDDWKKPVSVRAHAGIARGKALPARLIPGEIPDYRSIRIFRNTYYHAIANLTPPQRGVVDDILETRVGGSTTLLGAVEELEGIQLDVAYIIRRDIQKGMFSRLPYKLRHVQTAQGVYEKVSMGDLGLANHVLLVTEDCVWLATGDSFPKVGTHLLIAFKAQEQSLRANVADATADDVLLLPVPEVGLLKTRGKRNPKDKKEVPALSEAQDHTVRNAVIKLASRINDSWDDLVKEAMDVWDPQAQLEGCTHKEVPAAHSGTTGTGPPVLSGISGEHARVNHYPFDHQCADCVKAMLRSRPHRRNKKPAELRLGRLDIDIAVYQQQGPYCLVGITSTTDAKPLIVAEPLSSRKTDEIRYALTNLIMQCEHVWKTPMIQRIHGDREGGVVGNVLELHEAGLWATFTQGFDSKANGRGEGAIRILQDGARVRLAQMCEGRTALDITRRMMWPWAMVHMACTYSAHVSAGRP